MQSILIDNCYDSDMKVVGAGLLQCDNTVIWCNLVYQSRKIAQIRSLRH